MGGGLMKEYQTISIRFPMDTFKTIKLVAENQHRSASQQIVYLCEKAMVEDQEKEKVEVK